jgi:hypothetical protein
MAFSDSRFDSYLFSLTPLRDVVDNLSYISPFIAAAGYVQTSDRLVLGIFVDRTFIAIWSAEAAPRPYYHSMGKILADKLITQQKDDDKE